VRAGGGIPPPVKIHHVTPAMPEEALKAGVQGIVILEITVAEDGSVQNPRVLRSIPLLDAAALSAVSQWRYQPALLNGQPVPVILTVTVPFTPGR
jgi:protein TonB